MALEGMPADMAVEDLIVEKTLKNGMYVEVRLVKRPRQYEAALFIDSKYKSGPPLPRLLETPNGEVTHFMGVRPSVGLTRKEAETIEEEVLATNSLKRLTFKDVWGKDEDE
jgi:hypothetical protein